MNNSGFIRFGQILRVLPILILLALMPMAGFFVVSAASTDSESSADTNGIVTLPKTEFSADEQPVFTVEVGKRPNVNILGIGKVDRKVTKVDLTGPDGKAQPLQYEAVKSDLGGMTYDLLRADTENFTQPGKYSAAFTLKTGNKEEVIREVFYWGVLVMNPDQAEYRPGENATVDFGMVDDTGNTVCNAEMKLTVTNPFGKEQVFSTANGSITVSKECGPNSITKIPDYRTEVLLDSPGEYRFRLEAADAGNKHAIEQTVLVMDDISYEVRRIGPSRIWPQTEYPMNLYITPQADYRGTVEESLPSDFAIKPISAKGKVVISPDKKIIRWDVDWRAGKTYQLNYTFDAPDVSPALFTLGPVSIGKYIEPRQWQIASDSTGSTSPARLWMSGFELNSTTAGVEYTSSIISPTISNTTYRSGSYALRSYITSSGYSGMSYTFWSPFTAVPLYVRTYLYIASAPSATTKIMALRTASAVDVVSLRLTSGRVLQLWNDEDSLQVNTANGWSGGDSAALNTGQWYRIEMRYDMGTNATADTIAAARIDGVEFASGSTLNYASGTGSSAQLAIGSLTSINSVDVFFDDVAINCPGNPNGTASSMPCTEEPTGMGNDYWPGDGKIVYLRPNGNGTSTSWTAGLGSCTAADYTCVDEAPTPSDSDYVNCVSNNNLEDYNLTDSGTAGIGANDAIKLLQTYVRVTGVTTTTSGYAAYLGLNGTFDSASGVSLATTTWYTNDDTSPANTIGRIETTGNVSYGGTSYSKPGTTTDPWTPTDLDSAQVRLNGTDCSPDVTVSAVWVQVEYVPAEGGRIYSSGFELQSVTADVEWTTIDSTPTIDTTTVRGGNASLNATATASTRKGVDYQFAAANGNGPYWFRTYFRAATLPNAEDRFMDFRDSSGNARAYLTVDGSGTLKLYDDVGNIGTGATTIVANGWYRIELKIDASGAGATDTVEAKLDGTNIATSSTRTLGSGVAQIGLGNNLGASAGVSSGSFYFDDVALNKNAGTVQNGYPGAGKIALLRPNAAGDSTAWSVNIANCAALDYTCVDEITPDDATGDVLGSTTLNQFDEFDLDSTATAGIPSGATVNLVSVGIRFNNSATTLSAIKVRLQDAANATPIESYLNDDVTASTYFTNNDSLPRNNLLTSYTHPHQTTAWTTTDLDSAQIGVRLAVDGGANNIGVATMWLVVDYSSNEGLTGFVYSDEGSTKIGNPPCDGSTSAVRAKVNGNGSFATSCAIADSGYTLDMSAGPMPGKGDVVTVFLDNVTANASAVTRYQNSRATIDLYQNEVIARTEDGTSLTTTNMDQYDSGNEGDGVDGDIGFTVTGGALTVSNTRELHVWTGDNFTPGGTITTNPGGTQSGRGGDLHIAASTTLTMGTNNLSIGGDYNNAGTFAKSATQITTFTATATGFTITAGTGNFANLTFDGVNGDWTTQTNSVTVDEALTITNGTLKMGAVAHTVTGATSITGTLELTSNTGAKTFVGGVTINATGTWNNSAPAAVTFRGGLTNNSAVAHTWGTVTYTFDTNDQAIGGSNAITMSTVASGTAAKTLTNNGTLTITAALSGAGNFTNGATGVLNENFTGAIGLSGTFSASTSGNTVNYGFGGTQTVKAVTYHHLTLSNSGAKTTTSVATVNGDLNMSGSATTTTDALATVGGSIILAGTSQLTVGTVALLTVTGDLTVGTGTLLTIGISTTVNGGDITVTSTGALASSGTPTVTMGAAGAIGGNGNVTIYNLSTSGTGTTVWSTTGGTHSITHDISVGAGTTLDIQTSMDVTGNIATTTSGIIDSTTGTPTVTVSGTTIGGGTGAITFYNLTKSGAGSTTWTNATGGNTVKNDLTISAGTFVAPAGTLNVGASFQNSAGFTHSSGTIALTTSAPATISGSTTFNNLSISGIGAPKTITFVHDTTQIVAGLWTVAGTLGNVITLQRDNTSAWNINPASASVDYATVSWSNSSLAICAIHSTDGLNNSANWTFTSGASCGIDVSGTSNSSGGTVRVAVNNLEQAQFTTLAATWTISGVSVNSTDVVTVYVEGLDGVETTGVTQYDGTGNIGGLVLDTNVVTIGSSDNQNIDLTDLAKWDCSDNENVMYSSSGGTLDIQGCTNSYDDEKVTVLGSNTLAIGNGQTMNAHNVTINTSGALTSGTNGVFGISGSWDNNGTFTPSTSTVTFNSAGTETVEAGTSSFNNVVFDNASGTWTVQTDNMTTNDLTLNAGTSFTLANTKVMEVDGNFSQVMAAANTTWTGSTLYLNGSGGMYDINTKTHGGDTYATLRVGGGEDIAMWDSSASTYTIDAGGCLFSEDHGGTGGRLNIFGTCNSRSNEYWSYATDFDGAAVTRQADVRFVSGATMTVDNGDTLEIKGQNAGANRSLVNYETTAGYGLAINGSIDAQYYDFDNMNASGLNIGSTATVTELSDGTFDNAGAGASSSYITVANITSTKNFFNNVFDDTADGGDVNVVYNINADGAGIDWTFFSWSGSKAGESFDNEANGAAVKWHSDLTLAVSKNVLDLGVINTLLVGSDSHNLTVTTSAQNGYTCSAVEDGNLRNGTDEIADVVGGTVTAGTEGYGISCTGTDCDLAGDNGLSGTPLVVASNAGPVTDSLTAVTYKAAASSATVGTSYSNIVTFTCAGDF